MSKALVLVGMENADIAYNFRRELVHNLAKCDGIPVRLSSMAGNGFETPNVEVKFIWDPRTQVLDGLRADAVYGADEYRKPLWQYAKPKCLKVNRVGLRDWIVFYEREKELEAKNALNSVHGRDGHVARTIEYIGVDGKPHTESRYYNLAKAAAKCGASLTIANNPYLKNMLDEYRKEHETMSISPVVMALANHQGPATIHAGGMSIPVKIMDIDSESHPYKGTETSLRCMVVNLHDIQPDLVPAYKPVTIMAEVLNDIVKRSTAEKKPDRFAIKRVKLGKAPAIYWENGDKTSIVGPEWYCHSEVHAMAVLFNLRQQGIAQVIFNNPVTMVRWEDGSKVTVRCQEGDVYSAQVGLDMCLAKHLLGTNKNQSNYYDVFKKWLPKDEAPVEPTVIPGPVDIEAEEAVADGE